MRAITPIVYGIDPGSRMVAWTRFEVDLSTPKPTFRFDEKGTIEVGHQVDIAPRKRKNAPAITHETMIDDDDLAKLRDNVDRIFWGQPRWTIVTLERVIRVKPRGRMSAHMATCLASCSWVGGEIASVARERGFTVQTVDAEAWRLALTGKTGPTDREVARAIRERIEGWPAQSNAHERDSGGVCVHGYLSLNYTNDLIAEAEIPRADIQS